ncbi:uncharacterized protein Triagg1_10419 [Trichoderma aggressivum f. europaeum]|uniref:Uncharacterized protein n=1 Tax=Trichoderma aggressivum f. europaeum TaxID=173218 RepID=A0AAE1I6Z0_9HYPO|nr:hypothetical protein Triagg1_10419 [Trichoderma aggressivum f. europaeum]
MASKEAGPAPGDRSGNAATAAIPSERRCVQSQTAQHSAAQQQHSTATATNNEDAAPGTGAIQNKAPALGPAVGSGGSQAPVMPCKRGKNACMLMLCSALDESQSLILDLAAVSPSRARGFGRREPGSRRWGEASVSQT